MKENRNLMFHLVNVVWQDCNEDESIPSSIHAMRLIQKAIKLYEADETSVKDCCVCDIPTYGSWGKCGTCELPFNPK